MCCDCKYLLNDYVSKKVGEFWVKVGESAVAKVDIEGDAPYFDDLMDAVKLKMSNDFKTTDSCRIIIRDPITKVEIPATELLTLTSLDFTSCRNLDGMYNSSGKTKSSASSNIIACHPFRVLTIKNSLIFD